jgi:hypothetical protein
MRRPLNACRTCSIRTWTLKPRLSKYDYLGQCARHTFKGVMGFQSASPQSTREILLDRLGAQIQQSGKRVFMESADEMVVWTVGTNPSLSATQSAGESPPRYYASNSRITTI